MNLCLPEVFDLIHSRAVLTHLAARDVVLDKMVRALHPGGWLLLEEVDGFPLAASGSEFFIKMTTPMVKDWTWARKLPSLFVGHGLKEIGAEVVTKLFNGGSPGAEFWRQRVEGARDRWLRGGATDESVNALCRLLQDPNFWTFHSANISAWGRRPTQ